MSIVVAAALLACGADPGVPDGGGDVDAATVMDAGARDSATLVDGSPDDARSATDGGNDDAGALDASTDDAGADGGGDATSRCMAACDHVTTCIGFDACASAGTDCTSAPPSACLSNCIEATPCAELSTSTFAACDSMCAPDAGMEDGGVSSDAGSGLALCQSCSTADCSMHVLDCYSDSACMAWIACMGGATDAAAARACDAAHPNSISGRVYSCQCTYCPSECAVLDPCGATG